MESERALLNKLITSGMDFPPLQLQFSEPGITITSADAKLRPDLFMQAIWRDRVFPFVAEVKRYGSDKEIRSAAYQAIELARYMERLPLVITPWLSEQQLAFLQEMGVSGLDLCGNGCLNSPGSLFVFKSGKPNKFPVKRSIRNIFKGTSSLVPRTLALKPHFSSVSEVLAAIRLRGGAITLPTVSKVLSELEQDLIVEKTNGAIRVLQREKLLDNLVAAYQDPDTSATLKCKVSADRRTLCEAAKAAAGRFVLAGDSSVDYYGSMAREPLDRYYCSWISIPDIRRTGIEVQETPLFANSEFRIVSDPLPFFDIRFDGSIPVASPLQSYLELANSDKRGQETAHQLRDRILMDAYD